ncbi:hypothetical protein [Nocardiopsis synnemataformans]|uniref:hypothetical protein n=1 Tax=Nocardiopsis synnemataformans TaxID=61305 RepID=UPI003EBC051D
MSRSLSAPDGSVWATDVLTGRYPDLEEQSHGVGYVFAALAAARLAADVALLHHGVPAVAPITPEQARAALVLIKDAAQAPRYAELWCAHSAHALGMTWEEIAALRGKASAASYRKRLERIQAEFAVPTYELPARPVLGEYHRRAAQFLDTTLGSRPVNPYQRAAADDLLAVLLFLRTTAGHFPLDMRTWLEEDDLSPALASLGGVHPDQAGPAGDLLRAHTSGDPGFRAAVADLVIPALDILQIQQEQREGIVRCRACHGQIEPPDGAFVTCPNCGEPDPVPALRENLTAAQNEGAR